MRSTTLEAWAVAMGWGQSAVYSHAARLSDAGWAGSCQMTHGAGSLIYATGAGVRVAGVSASASAAGAGADDVGALRGVRVGRGVADRAWTADGGPERAVGGRFLAG